MGAADQATQAEELTPTPAARQPATLGQWIDGGLVRFRVDAITSCGPAGGRHADAPARPGTGTPHAPGPTASRQPATLLAFSLRFVAGAGEVFVSPRDVTLESGGVILQTTPPTVSLVARCAPALTARRLPARQTARGTVLFEISPEFRAGQGSMELVYRPTRWGGAGRLSVRIPACLDNCKERPQ